MLGGQRRKATGLLTNIPELDDMSRFTCHEANRACDRTGVAHLDWSPEVSDSGNHIQYKTEGEAEYPDMMCKELAGRVCNRLEAVQCLRRDVKFDFSEIYSGPNFPLTKAVGAVQLGIKKVVLVPRATREKLLSSSQPLLGRVGT